MTGSGLYLIQAAVYAALTGDVTLMAMISGVYDEAPAAAAYPYVSVGDATEIPFRTFGKGGHDETVTIHVWSRALGFKEAENIVSQATTVLEGATLVVSSHSTVMCNFEHAMTVRDPDAITRHIAARYRVVAQET